MDDVLGRSFSYMLLIFGFFFLVPLLLFANADISNRSYVGQALNEFVGEARESGEITQEGYQRLMNKLIATGEGYQISAEHRSKVTVYDGTEYQSSYRSYNYNDILSVMEGYGEDMEPGTADDTGKGSYPMKRGDYFTVTVKSNGPTLGSRFLAAILPGHQGLKLVCTSGGIVGGM